MKIETLHIKNYKVLHDVEVRDIPNFAVFLGKNGVGKSTFFDTFGFLNDCLSGNVNMALTKRGGFKEVVSRDQEGPICFTIKFRPSEKEPLTTYELKISLGQNNRAVVEREVLRFRRGEKGSPWKVLDFSFGEGYAAEGKLNDYTDVNLVTRKKQRLDSPDILAIKGLGQFREFEAVAAFRKLVEDWCVSDFQIDPARERQEAQYAERLNRNGSNLSVVAKNMFDQYPERFERVIEKMKMRVPGVEKVEAQETQDGYIVLRFQDGKFTNPFSAKFVSDGTIKMFTYLILLEDPMNHALLCIEEPENQLYPELLFGLAEEFREYANRGGQVFVSTHSPDFLNAVEPDEIYYMVKKEGYTTIKKASDNKLFMSLCTAGDLPGSLWKQGILVEE